MKRIVMSLALLLSCVFAVNVSAASDVKPPVVESIEVLTKEIDPGGKVKVRLKASDDISGVRHILLSFASPTEIQFVTCSFYGDPNGPLDNYFVSECNDISNWAEHGEWFLRQVVASDYADNSQSWYVSNKENTFMQKITFNVDPNAQKEEVEIDDGFKALESKKDVPVNKEFKIKFNMDVDLKTFTDHNVYVLDQYNNKVPVMFIVDRKTNKSASDITIMPLNNYRSASTYTLYVKDVKSTSGKILKQNTKMKFTTR